MTDRSKSMLKLGDFLCGASLFRFIWACTVSLCMLSVANARDGQMPSGPDWRDLQLRDHHGEHFTIRDHLDKPVIVSFVFTGCSSYCPVQTGSMGVVHEALAEEIGEEEFHVLSISITPKIDPPESMAAYARRFRIEEPNWQFVTGDADSIEAIGDALNLQVVRGRRPIDINHTTDVYLLIPGESLTQGFTGIPLDEEGLTAAVLANARQR